MDTRRRYLFCQAHLGMLFAVSGEDTHMRVGLSIAQEGVETILHGFHPNRSYDLGRIAICAERLRNFNEAQENTLTVPEGEHSILPGATYEGALVYAAVAATPVEETVGGEEVSIFTRELERFLRITARVLDERGTERIWRPHSGK